MVSASSDMAGSSPGAGHRGLRARNGGLSATGPRASDRPERWDRGPSCRRIPRGACSSEVLAEERDGPLARLLVARLVEAAALVAAETVAGAGVDVHGQVGVRGAHLGPVLGRDRRV